MITKMTDEFISQTYNDGELSFPTTEFNCSKLTTDSLNELADCNRRLKQYGYGWRLRYCETCKGYNEESPIHVEIELIPSSLIDRLYEGADLEILRNWCSMLLMYHSHEELVKFISYEANKANEEDSDKLLFLADCLVGNCSPHMKLR